MKPLLLAALVLMVSCKKEEFENVELSVWCGSCGIDYYNGSGYVHDTLGTMRDTIGPIVSGQDTIAWDVHVEEKHQFNYSYVGRRVYVRTTGAPAYYSYLSVTYGEDQSAHTTTHDSSTTQAVLDFYY